MLECREIYDYNDSDMAAQNGKIIAQIVAIGDDLAKLYLPEPAGAEPFVRRTLRRLLKLPPPSPQEPYYESGWGCGPTCSITISRRSSRRRPRRCGWLDTISVRN